MGGKKHPLEIYRRHGQPFGKDGRTAPAKKTAPAKQTAPVQKATRAKKPARPRPRKSSQNDQSGGWEALRKQGERLANRPFPRVLTVFISLVLAVLLLYTAELWPFSKEGPSGETKLSKGWRTEEFGPASRASDAETVGWWVQAASLKLSGESSRETAELERRWIEEWKRFDRDLRGRLAASATRERVQTGVFRVRSEQDGFDTRDFEIKLCAGWAEDRSDPWLQDLLEVVREDYADAVLTPLSLAAD